MTDSIHYHDCPLCGSSEIASFITATDHLVSDRQFVIARCAACGFLFTQDAPIPATISRYYESDIYFPHSGRSGFMPLMYRLTRYLMLHWKRSLIKRHHAQPGTVLDVGAGCGHFLAFMRRNGWSTAGCELSGSAREYARQRFNLVVDDDVMDCEYPAAYFDVITAWHSVEHIHDLHGLWLRFNRWIKSGGLLVIAVPNCDSSDAGHYGCRWAAWDVPRHLWHFNAKTMTDLGLRHGFSLIGVHAMPLDACYISILSDNNKIKGLANGLRFALRESFHHQQASSQVFLFRKANRNT